MWSRRTAQFELQHHQVLQAAQGAHDKGAKLRMAPNADIELADHPQMPRKVDANAASGWTASS
jgi:hypothetical protein